MIKNIIFDIGNVLVSYDPQTYFSQFFDEELNAFIFEKVFESKEWFDVDQGIINEQQASSILQKKLPGYEKQVQFCIEQWKSLMQLKEDSFALLQKLKEEGFHIYILSNIGEESYQDCVERFPFFDLVDGGVYSYQERLLKPDEKIYSCLMDRYELLPGECIFMDDVPKNIDAANAMGIHGIIFTDAATAEKEIQCILKEERHVTE